MSHFSRGSFDSSGNMDSAVDFVHPTYSSLSLDKDVDRRLILFKRLAVYLHSTEDWILALGLYYTSYKASIPNIYSYALRFPILTTWIDHGAGRQFDPMDKSVCGGVL